MTTLAPTDAEFRTWIRDYCDQNKILFDAVGGVPIEIYIMQVSIRWYGEGYPATLFDKHVTYTDEWYTDNH